jgi:hypothetical protein
MENQPRIKDDIEHIIGYVEKVEDGIATMHTGYLKMLLSNLLGKAKRTEECNEQDEAKKE